MQTPVQERIKELLSQGKSKQQLAAELGIARQSLENVLSGVQAGPKVLRRLGLRKIMTYVRDDNAPSGVPPSEWRQVKARRAKSEKSAQRRAAAKAAAAIQALAPEPPKAEAPKLTVERIQVALKYGLNPGKAWSEFLNGDWLDWEGYCASRGSQAIPPQGKALGAPGELYSHLRPVNRGQDFTAGASAIPVEGRLASGGVVVHGGAVSREGTGFEFHEK
jgi:transcriptional regulator with XRE-family HTH domain